MTTATPPLTPAPAGSLPSPPLPEPQPSLIKVLWLPLCAVVATAGLRAGLNRLEIETPAFLFFPFAVMVSAWLGGARSGYMATCLGMLVGAILLTAEKPDAWTEPNSWIRLLGFAGVGGGISMLTGNWQRTQRIAERHLEDFRMLVAGTRETAIYALDCHGYIQTWNVGAELIKGYTAAEVIGTHVARFYTPEQIEAGQSEALLAEAAETGSAHVTDWRVRKDGSRFRAEVTITALRDERGQLRGYSKITRDVTEREQRTQALERTNATTQALLESAAQGIVGVDHTGSIRIINAMTERMFGYTREELIGAPLEILLPAGVRDGHKRHREVFTANPVARPMGTGLTLAGRRRDGVEFPVEVSLSHVRTEDREQMLAVAFISDISERKRIEDRVRNSEQHLRRVLDSLFTYVAVLTPDGTLMEVNRAPLAIAALDKTAVIGRYFADCPWWDDLPDARKRVSEAIADARQGNSSRFDLEMRMEQGRLSAIDFMLTPMRDGDGTVTHLIASSVPIDERKRAERELQRSEARLRRIVNSGMVGVMHWRMDGTIVSANDAFLKMIGYDGMDLESPGINWQSITPSEWVDVDRRALAELQERGTMEALEKEYWRRDGTRVPVIIAGAAFDDQPDEGISLVMDVTDRKQAETALRDSEARWRTLIDAAPALVWVCKPDGRAIYLNQSWCSYTGMSEAMSQGAGWMQAVHPEDLETSYRAWEEARDLGLPYEVELRYRRHDGSYRWHVARALLARDTSGEGMLWFGMSADIEDAKRLQQWLSRSNEDLKQFAWAASHDLQEPLRMVVSFTQMLERKYGPKLDDSARQYMRYATEGASRMEALLAGLREYWNAAETREPSTFIDLHRCLSEALANLSTAREEAGAEITCDSMPHAVAEHTLMVQLFQNLIGNAMKYRDPQRPAKVHVGVSREEAFWKICVSDNGIGIESQYLAQVFGIFRRLHTRTNYPGTGIGLALCQTIVERHGGRIWVESEHGKGSSFCFTLPYANVR